MTDRCGGRSYFIQTHRREAFQLKTEGKERIARYNDDTWRSRILVAHYNCCTFTVNCMKLFVSTEDQQRGHGQAVDEISVTFNRQPTHC